MPIFTEDELFQNTNPTSGEDQFGKTEQVEKTEHGLGEVVKSAFQTTNIIGSSLLSQEKAPDVPFLLPAARKKLDPNFKFQDYIAGYEKWANWFIYTNTEDEVNQVKQLIDSRIKNEQILQESGFVGIAAQISAGMLDPTILIPAFSIIRSAKVITKVGGQILSGAALSATAIGTQEAIVQAQGARGPDANLKDDLILGAMFGGIIGGVAGFLAKNVRRAARTEFKINATIEPQINLSKNAKGNIYANVGAAENFTAKDLESMAKLNERVVKAATGPAGITRPVVVEGLLNEFTTIKQFTNALFEHNYILGKTLVGKPTTQPYTSIMKQEQALLIQARSAVHDLFLDYVGVGKGPFKGTRAAIGARRQGKLTYTEFNEEVAKAMRRGDTHKIPQVQAAAQLYRSRILDRLTKELQEAGILDTQLDVKTAMSYFMRRYNISKITANRRDFHARIANDLLEKQSRGDTRLAGLDRAEIDEKASNIIDNIIGLGEGRTELNRVVKNYAVGVSPKFTKSRVWDIKDEAIEDFLINDAEELLVQYGLQSRSLLAMHRILNELGFENLADLRKALKSEIDTAIVKAGNDTTKISKEAHAANKLVDDMITIALGTGKKQSVTNDLLGLVRKYNITTMLVGVLISSLPDIAGAITVGGLERFIKSGLVPAIRNVKKFKASTNELKHYNLALELEENEILKMLSDPDYRIGVGRSKIEKYGDVMIQGFGKVTGITYWNHMWRRIIAHVSMAETIEKLERWKRTGRMKPRDIERLARFGIGKEDYNGILKQFKKYGAKESGSYISGVNRWDDRRLADIFGSAVQREVDSKLLLPGPGDLPRLASKSEVAKTVFQFKSFAFAATNRILLAGLQERSSAIAIGAISAMTLGGLSWIIKEQIAGRTPEITPQRFFAEGFIRSGLGGIMTDYIVGLNPFGGISSSRYAGQNATNILFGPTAGQISNAFSVASGISDGDLSKGDIRRLQRLVPYQNLFYLKLLMNEAFDEGN